MASTLVITAPSPINRGLFSQCLVPGVLTGIWRRGYLQECEEGFVQEYGGEVTYRNVRNDWLQKCGGGLLTGMYRTGYLQGCGEAD